MPLLEMKHITKSFAGVYANEDVDLSVEQGEIHAVMVIFQRVKLCPGLYFCKALQKRISVESQGLGCL